MSYADHATRCGIDMTGREAVPVAQAVSRWCAVDVLNPETLAVLIPAGWWINSRDVAEAVAYGVDYVVVDA